MADCAVRRTKIPRQLSTSTMTRFAASLRQTIPMAARPPCHTATLRFLRALPHLAKSPLANTSRAHLSWTASVTWSAPRSPATRIAQAVTEPTRAMTASAMSHRIQSLLHHERPDVRHYQVYLRRAGSHYTSHQPRRLDSAHNLHRPRYTNSGRR